ncbi:molybdate ABC transporter permease subunit [Dehalococcoidia bacterium]|nr:molybdate ABC transporter permease subunit [Dehalococcoidia bacterium]
MFTEIQIIILSLKTSICAMLVVFPIGLSVAWLLTRTNIRGKFFIELLASLPLALPPVVTGYFFLWFLGSGSVFGSYIQTSLGMSIPFSWMATVIASAVVAFPLTVRSFISVFQSVDFKLEQSARGLGAGGFKTFFAITIPLSKRGILAGLVLGFARAFSEFGATIVFAGNIPGETTTVPLAIYTSINTGNVESITKLIIASVVIAALTLALYNLLAQNGRKKINT